MKRVLLSPAPKAPARARGLRAGHLVPLLALLAACGGKSCSCMAPIPGGFPTDARRHENAMQVRVTGSALDYLGMNGKALVDALLPSGSTFNVPPSGCSGTGTKVCCGTPQPTCGIDIGVQTVTLATSAPATLTFDIDTQLVSTGPIPIEVPTGLIGTAKCFVSVDTTKSTTQYKSVDLTGDVGLAVDATTDLTSMSVTNVNVAHLDGSMLTITPQPGDFLCLGVGLGPVKDLVVQQLQKQLGSQVSSAASGALCESCKAQSDCDSFADACTSGQCTRKGTCLQEIGAQGRLDLASLSSFFASTGAQMDILAVLGGYAETPAAPANGVSLGMLGGAEGAAHNPCVPVRPAPAVPTVSKWTQETQNTEPATNMPYHVGIGVHESELNTLAFAAYDSGALCLDVGTKQVAMIDSKTLGLLFPSLTDLTHDVDTQMVLAVRPSQEPHITIGAGTWNVDAMGNKTIEDPILHVQIPALSIDIYALIEERFDRIATLTADVAIGVGLDVDAEGRVVPMIGDLSNAFSNVTVTNTKLISESPAALAKSFPALLGAAAGALGKLSPISLPKVMGLQIAPVAIEPIDETAEKNGTFMAIFANLALAQMDAFHADTSARVARVDAPPTEAFRADVGLLPVDEPTALLALDGAGRGGDASDLEWSVRLDGGFWTPYSRARGYTLRDTRLWLQGRHSVDVRARVVGDPVTTDPTPTTVELLVDTVAPTGSFDVEGGALSMSATDAISPPEAIRYSYKIGDGAWSDWSTDPRVVLAGAAAAVAASLGADGQGLSVRAMDEAGNVGSLDFHGRETQPPTSGGCGCHVGERPHLHPERALAFAWLLALGLAVMLRRSNLLLRRSKDALHHGDARHRALRLAPAAVVLGLAAFALALVAGCSANAGAVTLDKTQELDPGDQIGRYESTAALDGTIHVSAYDDNFGDLAYAEIKAADVGQKPLEWQWVDGVPTDSPSVSGSYRRGSMDAGDDVGLYTSLALTKSGDPRIAYYDNTNHALKFASGQSSTRAFTVMTLDTAAPGGSNGMYASLVLDGNDVPSIAYLVTDLADGKGGYESKLRLATAASASPKAASDWTFVDVDASGIPCDGLCAKGEACVDTDPKDPTRSVCEQIDANPCKATCSSTQACVNSACVATRQGAKAFDIPEGVALYAHLVRLPGGLRAIVYYDHEHSSLKLASETTPGKFTLQFVDGNTGTSDVGQFCNAAVAPDGTLHVVYEDAITDRLLYKTVTGGMPEAMPEVVDDGQRMNGPDPVGAGAAVWTDGTTVEVAYQDQRLVDLWLATRAGSAWTKKDAQSGNAGYGYYPSLVSDGGTLFLAQFVYDRNAQAMQLPLGSLSLSVVK